MFMIQEELRHPRRRTEIGRLANPAVNPVEINLRIEMPQARTNLAEAARRITILQRVCQYVRCGSQPRLWRSLAGGFWLCLLCIGVRANRSRQFVASFSRHRLSNQPIRCIALGIVQTRVGQNLLADLSEVWLE